MERTLDENAKPVPSVPFKTTLSSPLLACNILLSFTKKHYNSRNSIITAYLWGSGCPGLVPAAVKRCHFFCLNNNQHPTRPVCALPLQLLLAKVPSKNETRKTTKATKRPAGILFSLVLKMKTGGIKGRYVHDQSGAAAVKLRSLSSSSSSRNDDDRCNVTRAGCASPPLTEWSQASFSPYVSRWKQFLICPVCGPIWSEWPTQLLNRPLKSSSNQNRRMKAKPPLGNKTPVVD